MELVRPVLQQQFLQNVGGQQRAPAGTQERAGHVAQSAVAIIAGRGQDLGRAESAAIQRLPQVGRILTKAARTLGRRHEEYRLGGIIAGTFQHFHEIAHSDLGRIALIAGSEAGAQLARAGIGRRRRLGLQAHGTKGRGKRSGAAVGHWGNVNFLADQCMPAASTFGCGGCGGAGL